MDKLNALAARAAAGDEQAMNGFVQVAYDEVWRLCAHLVDQQSAEDLAQEALIRAVRALPRFGRRSSARTWVLAITRYVCADEVRRRQRRRLAAVPWGGADVPGPDGALAVAQLVQELAPERREAFVLTQLLGLSYQEAADVCDCPVGTIRSRVARARTDLIDLLEAGESPGLQGQAH